MKNEFNLSLMGEERIISGISYREKDVKEFIKICEEIITRRCKGTSANCYEIKKEIKGRAGEKLTNEI